MRTFLVIAMALLISLPAIAQQQGGRGQGGGRGQAGGRGGQPPGGRGGPAADQAAPPDEPGFECIERAETPEFPSAALQARIDGTVWLRIQLAAGGTLDKLDSRVVSGWGTAPNLLGPPVEKAVRASKFKADCAGKTVAVAYRYDIVGEATANPKTTRRDSAHVMYLESQPQSPTGAKPSAPAK